MNDSLGDRMKGQYESRTQVLLPRRTHTIIRVDGRAFHTLTKGLDSPFNKTLATAMDSGAKQLVEHAQGACIAYLQSDEISVLLTDFTKPETQAWFDGNLQKLCSISASLVTAGFNIRYNRHSDKLATFDARAFTIPDEVEVENYFIWRQKDAERNSLQSLARMHYSHKELHGKNSAALHELLYKKGVNWADLTPYWRRGRCWISAEEGGWKLDDQIPVFTEARGYLGIPVRWGSDA